jgi:hypothetical protein
MVHSRRVTVARARPLASRSRAKPLMSARRTANRLRERAQHQDVNWRRSSVGFVRQPAVPEMAINPSCRRQRPGYRRKHPNDLFGALAELPIVQRLARRSADPARRPQPATVTQRDWHLGRERTERRFRTVNCGAAACMDSTQMLHLWGAVDRPGGVPTSGGDRLAMAALPLVQHPAKHGAAVRWRRPALMVRTWGGLRWPPRPVSCMVSWLR